jgi:O-acetyl-ADP-ribose deacetylase (regulator of RNase III)
VWHGGRHQESEHLQDCYRNSLQVAVDHNLRRIAFPSISTGVYGYPVDEAAKTAVNTVKDYIKNHPGALDLVEWVLFDNKTFEVYSRMLKQVEMTQ